MDATAFGGLLVGVSGLAAAIVAFLGKRGENAITGYTNLTGDLQEERVALKAELADRKQELATALAQAAADQARLEGEIVRLRGIIIQLGGDPS